MHEESEAQPDLAPRNPSRQGLVAEGSPRPLLPRRYPPRARPRSQPGFGDAREGRAHHG